MCVRTDGDSDRDVSDGGIWPKDPYRDDITEGREKEQRGGGVFQQTMSSEYQCRSTALSTHGTEALSFSIPARSSPSMSRTPLLLAFYHGALTPVLFPPLPHVHRFFSENSGCLLACPASSHSDATFSSALWFLFSFGLLQSLCTRGWNISCFSQWHGCTLDSLALLTSPLEKYFFTLYSQPRNFISVWMIIKAKLNLCPMFL